jgi:hypothetical protein
MDLRLSVSPSGLYRRNARQVHGVGHFPSNADARTSPRGWRARSNELAYTSTTRYRLNADNTVTALDKVIDAKAAFTQGAGDLVINEKY